MGSTSTLDRGREAARGFVNNRTLLGVLAVIALSNLIVFAVQRYVALPMPVAEHSMEPSLHDGEWIMVRRQHQSTAELARSIDRGDVLVFRAPHKGRPLVVKRIIGLPGETIEAHDGPIAIDNSTTLVEKWLPESERQAITIDRVHLEDDEVFVLGDNRDVSLDSRAFGPVKLDDVAGTVMVRFWPLDRMGTVDWT
jgi:signal peptidase I